MDSGQKNALKRYQQDLFGSEIEVDGMGRPLAQKSATSGSGKGMKVTLNYGDVRVILLPNGRYELSQVKHGIPTNLALAELIKKMPKGS